ncbi:esterase/lipase [Exophiala viscosa]|uniref:esterase/lipase n=1 Tax=Exophiala viscosa TaxID=2486360 RepID=UPI00218FB002|nr:esterase/lipase [Exophiala viscosa]
MPITTVGVGAAVTPTVVKTCISHYTNRKPRRYKPTAHISYDEGFHLIRRFLEYASHHTVDDLQAFTQQWVPTPAWVRTENIPIGREHTTKAAQLIIDELSKSGVQQVGGSQWWQWRPAGTELKGEWIEMRAHYNELKQTGRRSQRIMLYIHGGAYFFGSVDEHRYQMQRHARKLKARVFAPRYRLAPQFPFPCGLQDCLAAYLYLLSIHDPSEIILAGDSAGGGMVVSILCLLRDQALPLPAGAVLISPWVDLTHSFPSLSGDAEEDYIPSHGFMHKPSASWPPPNDQELSTISAMAKGGKSLDTAVSKGTHSHEADHATAGQNTSSELEHRVNGPGCHPAVPVRGDGQIFPGPQLPLSIELDGKHVVLKDQIQMYTTNQLLAHPLVSPALQPSLGALPPICILTGGGEILRDEQIYLAHKMAYPSKYPLGKSYRSTYDPGDTILHKYKPTPVQLQVWDDLCHVAPTLSFTRPAKHMYRSVAQFGAWALARAQRRDIEIMDDDNISIISSGSESENNSTDSEADGSGIPRKPMLDLSKTIGSVGRAGDPLPPFENHMLRQRIDRGGNVYALLPPHELPGCRMHPDDVGVVKPGPVRKWLQARNSWDTKYASVSKKVRKQRIRALVNGDIRPFEGGERPPASALASRRTDKDLLPKKPHKTYGLISMWSMWGSKHDEQTLKREEEAEQNTRPEHDGKDGTGLSAEVPSGQSENAPNREALAATANRGRSGSRKRSVSERRRASDAKSRGRARTVTVSDTGQVEGEKGQPTPHTLQTAATTTTTSSRAPGIPPVIVTNPATDDQTQRSPDHLSVGFIPNYKTASHRRQDSSGLAISDAASTMTGKSAAAADDASTRSLFGEAGVIQPSTKTHTSAAAAAAMERPGSPLVYESRPFDVDDDYAGGRSIVESSRNGYDTPRSQHSFDRLHSHQQDEGMGRLQPIRSPSSMAVVRAQGIVGVVSGDDGGHGEHRGIQEEEDADAAVQSERRASTGLDGNVVDDGTPSAAGAAARPKIYDRSETKFQTAREQVS